MKILVVDDSKSITTMITKYIQIKNPEDEICVADNGALALDRYAKFKPDIVILDLAMPVMDGIETLTRILKMDKNASVIITSAAGSEERIEQCFQKGALSFIEKPFSPANLIDLIKNIQGAGNYKKEIVTIFSSIASKLENSIDKIITNHISITEKITNVILSLPNVDKTIIDYVRVTLKDLVVIPMVHSQVPHLHNMTIKAVSDIEKSPQIDIPADCVGFTIDMAGQNDGILVSVINKNDLQQILRKNGLKVIDEDMILEFFNVINNKIITSISNSTHIQIVSSPVRSYNKDSDSILYGKDLTKAVFDISWKEKTISLMVYLWFNVRAGLQRF